MGLAMFKIETPHITEPQAKTKLTLVSDNLTFLLPTRSLLGGPWTTDALPRCYTMLSDTRVISHADTDADD